jgi:hypothetical protein
MFGVQSAQLSLKGPNGTNRKAIILRTAVSSNLIASPRLQKPVCNANHQSLLYLCVRCDLCARPLIGFVRCKVQELGALGDLVGDVNENLINFALRQSDNRVFHLHGFHHNQRSPFGDRLSGLN